MSPLLVGLVDLLSDRLFTTVGSVALVVSLLGHKKADSRHASFGAFTLHWGVRQFVQSEMAVALGFSDLARMAAKLLQFRVVAPLLTALVGGLAASLVQATGGGSSWEELAKVLPKDGAEEDRFGLDVAISGDTALIASRWDDDNGSESGSVYVFVRQGGVWAQQAKLLPNDGAAWDWFGSSVALWGNTALIGASRESALGVFSGSAYVFVREGGVWSQQAKLLAGDGAAQDWFGQSVALQADTAVIGADKHDHGGADSGSAYVFVRSGNSWSQQAELTATDAAAGDRLGFSVSLSGNTALAGAIWDDSSASNAGSAYVFVRNGTEWTQQAEIRAGDGASNDWYGWSVAVSQDIALVGAPRDDDNGDDSGAVYVFSRSRDSWIERPKLLAADGEPGDRLGVSISLSGEHALIGAYLDDNANLFNAGSAWIFTVSGGNWTERAKLVPSDPSSGALFGVSVALSGQMAVLGAGEDSQNGFKAGSAYFFSLPLVFEDGFESGDTSAWSVTIP